MFPTAQFPAIERRHDGPVEAVDTGLTLAAEEGVGPALEFMLTHGVDRLTALRVLSGPEFHRPERPADAGRYRMR
jgi:hypothetical protein